MLRLPADERRKLYLEHPWRAWARDTAFAVAIFVAFSLLGLLLPGSRGLLRGLLSAGVLGVLFGAIGMVFGRGLARRTEKALELRARREAEALDGVEWFDTPEAAALAGWDSAAQARVLDTRYLSAVKAEVVVDTVPSRPMSVICERLDEGWIWTQDLSA